MRKKKNLFMCKNTGHDQEYADSESIELSPEEEKRFYDKALETKILGKDNYPQCNHIYKYSHQEKIQTNSTGCNMTIYDVVVCEKCGDIKRTQTFNY